MYRLSVFQSLGDLKGPQYALLKVGFPLVNTGLWCCFTAESTITQLLLTQTFQRRFEKCGRINYVSEP